MNTINLKALSELASRLNVQVNILESIIKDSGITIQYTEATGFRSSKRGHVLSLYN